MGKLIVKAFCLVGLISAVITTYFISKLLFWVLLWIMVACILLIILLIIMCVLFTTPLEDCYDQGEHY